MSQYATIPCPSCGRELRVRDAYFGMNVSCKHCEHIFVARPEGARAPTPEEAPEDLGGRLADLERENRTLREKWAGEAERVRDALDRLETSEAKRAQYKDQRSHLLGLREKYKQQIAALQDELGQVQGRLRDGEAARDELAAARSELDALRAELPPLRERAAEADRLGEEVHARRSEMERLWTAIQEHRRRADSGEAALVAESERAAALRDELDRVGERLRQGEAAAAGLDAARSDLDAARSELDRLRDEVTALRTRADDADRLEDNLRAEADRAEALAKRLEAETARVAELLDELGPARERLRIADDERSALESSRGELARLGDEATKLRQRADDADRLDAEVRARRDEVARLRGELQESQEAGARASGSLSQELDEVSSERDRLGAELEGLRAEMEAQAAVAAEEVERLRGGLAAERAGREQLRGEASRLVAEAEDRAALAAQNDRLAADLDAARAECDRLRDEMVRLEDQLSERARAFDRLSAERAEAAHRDPGPSFSHGLSTGLVEPRTVPQAVLGEPSPAQGVMMTIRARPKMESEADPESLRADLEAWISYAHDRYRTLIAMAGGVEAHIRAARDDLTVLHRDMAIGQWGDDEGEGDDEFPFG